MTTHMRLLLAGVDPTQVQALTRSVNELGHTVCAAVSGRDLDTADLRPDRPDLAVVDVGLGREADDAIEAVNQIQRRLEIPVLYLADSMDDARLQRACMTAPFGYIVKPVDARQLQVSIDAAVIAHGRERHLGERAVPAGRRSLLERDVNERELDAWYAALTDTVMEASSEGIVVTDAAGSFVRVNPTARKMVGNRLSGSNLRDWLDGHDVYEADGRTPVAPEELPFERALHGQPWDAQLVFRRRTSEPSAGTAEEDAHVSIAARPILDAAGRVLGSVSLVQDITTNVTAAAQLERAVAELHERVQIGDAIVRSMSDGVVVVDQDQRPTLFNPSAERILGIGMKDVPAAGWSNIAGIFHSDRVTPVPSDDLPLVRAARGEDTDERELFVRNPDVPGGVFINVNATSVRDGSGNLVGGVAVFRDVTRQVAEREALLQAFASGRLEIIETVLHNIGNAINSVEIGLDTINQQLTDNVLVHRFEALADVISAHEDDWGSWLTTDPRGQKVVPYLLTLLGDATVENVSLLKTVERVQDRVRHIVDIIRTEELSTSRTEERTTVNLRSKIDDVTRALRGLLAQGHIKVDVDSIHAPREVVVHERRFQHMLVSLVQNSAEAIDEERARRLKLGASREEALEATSSIRIVAREDCDRLEIEVIDTGIGIEPEHMQDLYRAGYTTKQRGSGLGLHAAADFVSRSGGKIHAMSEGTGTGTTVRVVLPLGCQDPSG